MGLLKEFKEFAMKGSVLDMAVGIIIGAAFNKIVTSLVNDIIMPPLGMLLGGDDFKNLAWVLKPGSEDPKVQEVAIHYGQFISTVIDFLIVAFTIFMVLRVFNRLAQMRPTFGRAEPAKAAPAK